MISGEDDFTDRWGPMLVKELRQNTRRRSFVLPFLGVHALAIAAMIAEFQLGDTSSYVGPEAMLNFALLGASGPLWEVISLICVLIMPLGGLVLMTQEFEDGNHELLQLTALNRWKIVRGKFFTLWGLCVLTFVSLLPYVIVRYLVGSIELVREIACSLTVLAYSSIMAAGAIGASAFRSLLARTLMMFLFIGTTLFCTISAMIAAAFQTGIGILYHLHAVAAPITFTLVGLALARSRLRLTVAAYEMKPSSSMICLLILAPFIVMISAATTQGYGSVIGLVAIALIALFNDSSPKAPAWVPPPRPNIPPTPPAAA